MTGFITKDLRQVSVVNGSGFLNLMNVAEPSYVVPCRATIHSRLYDETKAKVMNAVLKQGDVSLTTDMWTSCADHGHITAALQSGTEEWRIEGNSICTCN